jgi:hypothetical protein
MPVPVCRRCPSNKNASSCCEGKSEYRECGHISSEKDPVLTQLLESFHVKWHLFDLGEVPDDIIRANAPRAER